MEEDATEKLKNIKEMSKGTVYWNLEDSGKVITAITLSIVKERARLSIARYSVAVWDLGATLLGCYLR